METAATARELENLEAIGGMRNPALSIQRLPGYKMRGKAIKTLLDKAQDLWPELQEPAKAILLQQEPSDLPQPVVEQLRKTIVKTLWNKPLLRPRTARAPTPIRSEVIAGWTEDPDHQLLPSWLDHGAPMGFADEIQTVGIFPKVEKPHSLTEANQVEAKTLEGWTNYISAEQEDEELQSLIQDYTNRKLCHLSSSLEEAERELGRRPILNRLGVIVKHKVEHGKTTKKARVIWDLRRSQANACCHQGERVLLPRLLDLVAGALKGMRAGKQVWIAAIDIKDAFMNIPVMKDRFATTAAKPDKSKEGNLEVIVFDTLVFGAARSPTIWGRFASWLGRTLAAVEDQSSIQVYVDDPAFILVGSLDEAVRQLTNLLLWTNIAGFPVKLQKATGGKSITWIGATISLEDAEGKVVVSIPEDKAIKLQETTEKFLGKPVVGEKELRSYAGSMSFVAGLIPHIRPFLETIWASLPSGHATASDGARHTGRSGKLVHVRRFKPALKWLKALLTGEAAPLYRELQAHFPDLDVTITTDACPFGLGGTLRVSGILKETFSSDLPKDILSKFKAQRGDSKHTTLWEALALLYACRCWLPAFNGKARVRCKSDSLSLMFMLLKGKAKSPDLAIIAREFALDQARDRYRIHFLSHIPGVTNIEADALSRIFAPVPPELPRSLVEAPRIQVSFGNDFWTVDA